MTALLLTLALFAAGAGADTLATARELYASAAYEDALAVLNRLPAAGRPAEEVRAAEQYRALCLLALGRTAEAQQAIETVVGGDPYYRPASDVSPRVRAAFSDVRKRMLPMLIQKKYTEAKAAFDKKDYASAAAQFTKMLEAMTDPDAEAAASRPPLSDLRTLAAGFRDLAVSAAAPAPPPAPTPAPAPAPSTAPAPPPAPVPVRASYTVADPNVVPPIVVRQELPPFPGQLMIGKVGIIEVVIGEDGSVENAVIRQSVSAQYDGLALAAAKTWRYRPATLNGRPVKYRKAIQVTVKPEMRR